MSDEAIEIETIDEVIIVNVADETAVVVGSGPVGPSGYGADGTPGDPGADGDPGEPGADGKSAYEIAVDNGYSGTEFEWLQTLFGPAGAPGTDGNSAYEVAVANGFVGSEAAWLTSLHGAAGGPGADGEDGAPGSPGDPGADGEDGAPGDPGADGEDGQSAYALAVNLGYSGTEEEWIALLEAGATSATTSYDDTETELGLYISTKYDIEWTADNVQLVVLALYDLITSSGGLPDPGDYEQGSILWLADDSEVGKQWQILNTDTASDEDVLHLVTDGSKLRLEWKPAAGGGGGGDSGIGFVGAPGAPETDADADRPDCVLCIWTMDYGLIPTNMIEGDFVTNGT